MRNRTTFEKPPIEPILKHYGAERIPTGVGWLKMKCPFHGDGHASASLHSEEKLFVCHGCGIKGNAYNIIMKHEGVTFRAALEIAKGIIGEGGLLVLSAHSRGRRVSGTTGDKSGRSGGSSIRSRGRSTA